MIEPAIIDFETEKIVRRPQYPPKPVGFSLKLPQDKKSTYYGWGHPTGNNCTREKARMVLKGVWTGPHPLLFHNGKFDVDVGETHMGMPRVEALEIHDTLFLAFLNDPYAKLALKEVAKVNLGMMPEERDILKEWILANVPEAKRKPSEWGGYISRAPGGLVGTYADGDVMRTGKLFKLLYKDIVERGMLAAYQREQRLMPVLLDTERQGIRCNWSRLERDYKKYRRALDMADQWLRQRLHVPDLNLDSNEEVGDALERNHIIKEWEYTPIKTKLQKDGTVKISGGQRSVAKKSMTLDKFTDQKVAQVWGYRQRLSTCLGTFFEPWLEMCRASNGIIYTQWNQVRQSGVTDFGTRTGRLSSTPNFQNIPTDFEDNNDGWIHPSWFLGLPPLPLMRRYLLPDEDHVWLCRDYAQQELRILAHFENGSLLDKYQTDPDYDMHDDVLQYLIDIAQVQFNRVGTKILNFGDIYGMGAGEFAKKARITVELAKRIKRAKRAMMPDFDALDRFIKQAGRDGYSIGTWGDRYYYCEEPLLLNGRQQTFEYKLLNYLIQGSAADCIKEAMIRYAAHPDRQARFLLAVHDEMNSSAPISRWKQELMILREVMESIDFRTVMYSDGAAGDNWADIIDLLETPRIPEQKFYINGWKGIKDIRFKNRSDQRKFEKRNPMHAATFGYRKGLRDKAVAMQP